MQETRTIRLGEERSRTQVCGGALSVVGSRPVAAAWRALLDGLPQRQDGPVLVSRDPAGVLAMAARWLWPGAAVTAHHLDAWEARAAASNMADNAVDGVDLALLPDLPAGPFGLVAMPFPRGAEALYGREIVERAHDALVVGGRLIAATDGSHGWLRKVVKETFGRADLQGRSSGGMVLTARRTRTQGRTRDHDHVARLVRGETTLDLLTRPGVFSPGRIDMGTRALLESFTAAEGERVLDLGCGVGALGLAAAVDAGPEGVVMVDSNVRAVATAQGNAERNGLAAAAVLMRADLEDLPSGFDRVLANPPYFSRGRIAAAFARAAATALSDDGVLHLVAKNARLHGEILDGFFTSLETQEVRGYTVFSARGPRAGYRDA